jgi:hypothetical protein
MLAMMQAASVVLATAAEAGLGLVEPDLLAMGQALAVQAALLALIHSAPVMPATAVEAGMCLVEPVVKALLPACAV